MSATAYLPFLLADPNWAEVALLLRWGTTTPVDVSPHQWALGSTRNGYPTQFTASSPYAAKLSGLAFVNHGIRLPNTPVLQFGAGDFTIEFWMNAGPSQTPYSTICDASTNNTATMVGVGMNVGGTAGRLNFNAQGGTVTTLVSQSNVLTNTWVHVACVKLAYDGLLFINGRVEAWSTNWGGVTNAYLSGGEIGGSSYAAGTSGDNEYAGVLTDFRVTTMARYTADFAPPSAPYPTS